MEDLVTSKRLCGVPGCLSTKNDGIDFHRFPCQPRIANLWRSALKLPKNNLFLKNLFVCGKHFQEKDYDSSTGKLNGLAVPSLILSTDQRQYTIQNQCVCKCFCGKSTYRNGSLNINPLSQNTIQTTDIIGVFHSYSKTEPGTSNLMENTSDPSIEKSPLFKDMYSDDDKNDYTSENSPSTEYFKLVILSDDENETENKRDPNNDLSLDNKFDEFLKQFPEKSSGDCAQFGQFPSAEQREYERISKNLIKSCPYCGFEYSGGGALVSHIRLIHYAMFPKGPLQDKDIYLELIKHNTPTDYSEESMRLFVADKTYTKYCKYCEVTFFNISALIEHVKSIHDSWFGPRAPTDEELAQGHRLCCFCNKYLKSAEEYARHKPLCILNKHGRKDPNQRYACEFCGISLRYTSVEYHVASLHSHNLNSYVCELCGMALKNSVTFTHHMLRHDNKRTFTCPEDGCNKTFNTPSGMRSHKNVCHTNSDKWVHVCDICDKRFPVKTNLQFHRDSHFDQLFSCRFCNKKFGGTFSLHRHELRYHSNFKRVRSWVAEGKGLNQYIQIGEDGDGPEKNMRKKKEKTCVQQVAAGRNCEKPKLNEDSSQESDSDLGGGNGVSDDVGPLFANGGFENERIYSDMELEVSSGDSEVTDSCEND